MKKILFTLFSSLLFLQISCQNKLADALFENFEYRSAIKYYNNPLVVSNHLFKNDSINDLIRIKLALSYFRIHDYENAENVFKEIIGQKHIDPMFYYDYAICLKNNKKYDDARLFFSKVKELDSTHYLNDLHLTSIDSLVIWDTLKENVEVAEIKAINSSLAEYCPRFYHDGILICSEQKYDSLKQRVMIDLFSSMDRALEDETEKRILEEKVIHELDYGESLSPRSSLIYIPLNEKAKLFDKKALYDIPEDVFGERKVFAENKGFNIGSFNIDEINDELYFTKTYPFNRWEPDISNHSLLYKANIDKVKHRLTKKKLVHIKRISKVFAIGEPAMSSDGNMMYFVSDKPKGEGGTDIYFIEKNKKGKWGKPINLGPEINTQCDELSPFLYDDKKLYFSTNGHVGYGGLDIYVVDVLGDSLLGPPEILSSPLNSVADDFGISLHPTNESIAIFVSNRHEGPGDDDLYLAHFTDLNPYVKGFVLSETGALQEGAIVRLMNENNEELAKLKTQANGKYRLI